MTAVAVTNWFGVAWFTTLAVVCPVVGGIALGVLERRNDKEERR